MKNFINNIKISNLLYLIDKMKTSNINDKIKILQKLDKFKITKEMGLLILDEINNNSNNDEFDSAYALLGLLFKNYYKDYQDKIINIYSKLNTSSKYELLYFLSNSNNYDLIKLYKELVLKYGKELNDIPIGILSQNINNYNLLFPEFYKCLKFNIKRNNIILLISDFINNKAININDLKKHKKLLQNQIIEIFKEACNYKHDKDKNIMDDKEYIKLRMYIEASINIELYVSNKETKNYLEKLLKKKDNQIKLFILENYVKKNKNISKIKLNTIARDKLSRYPLYSFLSYYNLERLMPKKYNNNKALSESELYLSYCISKKYNSIPIKMEFLEERVINNYKYYIYKFYTKYDYNEEIIDPQTDYILKTYAMDKDLIKNDFITYIGISGGYNKDLDPSIIEKKTLRSYEKYDDNYEEIIRSLTTNINIDVDKIIHTYNKNKKKKNKFNLKNIFKINKKEKVKKVKPAKIKTKKIKKEEILNENINNDKKPSLIRRIFSFNNLLTLICLILFFGVFVLLSYIEDIDLFHVKNRSNDYINVNIYKSEEIHNKKFKEISYKDIYNQKEEEYYVLFYNKTDKSVYHKFIDELIKNKYVIYYVDTSKKENKDIFKDNSTGFKIKSNTLLKVNNKEYEFYVVGKTNILHEFESYINKINKDKEKRNNRNS